MALIVPDSIPSTASQGEKTLYQLFKDQLPKDFYIWYEPSCQDSLPSFMILAPSFGLLLLKVLTLYPHQIISVEGKNLILSSQRQKIQPRDPNSSPPQSSPRRTRKRLPEKTQKITEKLLAHQFDLQKIRIYPEQLLTLQDCPILTKLDNQDQRQLLFPIGVGVVMSNMTEEQAREKKIDKLLSECPVIYREELLSWNRQPERDLVKELEKCLTPKLSFQNLTSAQIETIKGIIYPEIAIKKVPASQHSVPDGVAVEETDYVIKTLDHRQECIARAIGEGHRIIYGVAGSGKTLILLSRAKFLAKQNPADYKILILCFNRSLASHLNSLLHESTSNIQYKKIQCFTFHAWAASVVKLPGRIDGLAQDYWDELIGEKVLEELSKSEKWDAVLVDEAQTFFPRWLKCCVAALKDPDNGNLMIVSDGNQSLYKRGKFTWKSVGIHAVGRTSSTLYKNYRNTQEIVAAAWSLVRDLQNIEIPDNSEDAEATFPLIEPSAAIRQGSCPVLHILLTENQEVEAVIREIQNFCESGYTPSEIAILYRIADDNKSRSLKNIQHQLQQQNIETYWITESRDSEKNYSVKIPGVRIITALNALGLEFKVVLILWAQDWDINLSETSETNILNCRRLYVSMTRAQDVLHIFGSGNSPLLEQLKRSGTFEVRE